MHARGKRCTVNKQQTKDKAWPLSSCLLDQKLSAKGLTLHLVARSSNDCIPNILYAFIKDIFSLHSSNFNPFKEKQLEYLTIFVGLLIWTFCYSLNVIHPSPLSTRQGLVQLHHYQVWVGEEHRIGHCPMWCSWPPVQCGVPGHLSNWQVAWTVEGEG